MTQSPIHPPFSLRHLQQHLPWSMAYSGAFIDASPYLRHLPMQHAAMHVIKSLGRLAAMFEKADHARPVPREQTDDIPNLVADLVICALRMANVSPWGAFDLLDAVVKRIEWRNGTTIPAGETSADPQNAPGAHPTPNIRTDVAHVHAVGAATSPPTPSAPADSIDEALDLIEGARELVRGLANGTRQWTAHIPVLDVDSDVILGKALLRARAELGAKRSLMERLERAESALIRGGYTYTEGAEQWKPPVNEKAGELKVRLLYVEKQRDEALESSKRFERLAQQYGEALNARDNRISQLETRLKNEAQWRERAEKAEGHLLGLGATVGDALRKVGLA